MIRSSEIQHGMLDSEIKLASIYEFADARGSRLVLNGNAADKQYRASQISLIRVKTKRSAVL